ncbi:MAG: WD40 repeat domain-containing protein, partial [Roseimicrobium sp.]
LGEGWAISQDGKRIVGRRFSASLERQGLEMHHLDTLEGIWTTSKNVTIIHDIAFSKDGKWLALLHLQRRDLSDKRDYAVTILEADTGKQVQLIRLIPSDNAPLQHLSNIAFTKDALWVAPGFNEDGQIVRIALGDWKKTLASDPVPEEHTERYVVISADEKWIVVWGGGKYRVMEPVGDKLAMRFEGETEYSEMGPDGFTSITISPDSRLLAVSGNGKHKVIDLEDRKVVHEDTKSCLCGLFAPDGKTFWGTCSPFRPLDTRTWTLDADTVPGHRSDIKFVAFSPDGKLLATQDVDSIYVWTVDGTAPPRKLESAPDGAGELRSLEWKPDGTEIWSANGVDFIRWPLSGAVLPNQPQISEKLFPSRKPGESEWCWQQYIKAVPGTDLCYLLVAHKNKYDFRYTSYEELRSPSKPSVVKPIMGKSLLRENLHFSKSGEEIFDIQDKVLTAFKWSDGTVRKGMAAENMSLEGGGLNGPLVLNAYRELILVDPNTLQKVGTLMPSKDAHYGRGLSNLRGCFSADGQWFACTSSPRRTRAEKAPGYLVNLKGKDELYTIPPTNNSARSGAFSPDGRILAIGHSGGLVSLWDVEKIKSMPAPMAEEPTKPLRGPMVKFSNEAWDWPGPGITLPEGDKWTFTDDGGVQCVEAGATAGQLLIDGKPPKALGSVVRGMSPQNEPTPSNLRGELELRSEDGRVRVSRLITAGVQGSAQW